MRRTGRVLVLMVCAAVAGAGPVAAQVADSSLEWSAGREAARAVGVRVGRPGTLESAAMVAFGMVTLVALDAPVRRALQDGRSPALDALSDGARQFGEWRVHIAIPLLLGMGGLVSGERGLVRAGAELAASTLAAGGVVGVLKHGFGRQRPHCVCSPLSFDAAGPGRAFPSGHTAAAFAAATVAARYTGSPWIRAGLYAAASLTAWSRMNDDKHWLSDVAAGAALGTLTARAVTGRLGLRPGATPRLAASPRGATVSWSVEF